MPKEKPKLNTAAARQAQAQKKGGKAQPKKSAPKSYGKVSGVQRENMDRLTSSRLP